MSGLYILDGHMPVPAPSVEAWGAWFETADRRVRLTRVGPYHVSTVFLGMDHNFSEAGAPILFETMVYCEGVPYEFQGLSWLDEQARCSTWEQAEAQHEAMIAAVREAGDEVVCVEGAPIQGQESWQKKLAALIDGSVEFTLNFEPPDEGEKGSN